MADQDQRKVPAPEEDAEGGVSAPVDEDRRPTPVRMAMEIADEEQTDSPDTERVIRDGKEGGEWVVMVTGRSASGILPLRTVPLMELTFAKVEDPARPLRQSLCHGTDLADIPDHELRSLLDGSDPFQDPVKAQGEPGGKRRKGENRRPPSG